MASTEKLQGISEFAKTEQDRAVLREHLEQIVSGEAFKGSRRSAQFLTYIIDRALESHADILKERTIGVELFGRAPSYDTGEDAIVRVTATDVRRRLLQHYGRIGEASEFRISLPSGGYIPEIEKTGRKRELAAPVSDIEVRAAESQPKVESSSEEAARKESAPTQVESPLAAAPLAVQHTDRRVWLRLLLAFTAGIAVTMSAYYVITNTHGERSSPWNAVLHNSKAARVVISDPDISQIQALTSRQISVSDYANEKYGCEWVSLQNGVSCSSVFHGDKFAAVDMNLLEKLKQLAKEAGASVSMQPARAIRLPYLRTNDDYILLGSARSNPWVQLFSDQMDFVLTYNDDLKQEVVQNQHPRAGEQTVYNPTAKGFGTGESFSTISLLRNPDQTGHVLLLAGISAEATQAAGDLVTDLPALSSVLTKCGVQGSSVSTRYQILLKVRTMAGAATQTSVVACHRLD